MSHMTIDQLATLRAAVFAAPTAAAMVAAGNVIALQGWCNGNSGSKRWLPAADTLAVEEAPSYTTYDTIAQGKRDSWLLFLANPRDFGKPKVRKWVTDVWGNATAGSNAEAVLQAGTVNATRAQVALGGAAEAEGTVSAYDCTYEEDVDLTDATRLIFKDDGTIWTAQG